MITSQIKLKRPRWACSFILLKRQEIKIARLGGFLRLVLEMSLIHMTKHVSRTKSGHRFNKNTPKAGYFFFSCLVEESNSSDDIVGTFFLYWIILSDHLADTIMIKLYLIVYQLVFIIMKKNISKNTSVVMGIFWYQLVNNSTIYSWKLSINRIRLSWRRSEHTGQIVVLLYYSMISILSAIFHVLFCLKCFSFSICDCT